MARAEQGWSSESVAALGALWDAGVPTMEIARRLGRTRSCILGKSRRIGLRPRHEMTAAQAASMAEVGAFIGRPGQIMFRRNMLENYNFCCPITGCSIEQVLQAAHVIPFGRGGSFEISNGIVLRADLHAMFDAGLMAISPTDFTILWSPRVADFDYTRLKRAAFERVEHLPSCEGLTWHIRNVFRASG
ncbi:HNH endonuclease [Sphingobium sp. WTD-1]|uniref:HNH endonuclease n=1 Tax=Sphingobium sp. WTD-1 TaxID=2979467 RepID=UPI0024DDF969|nr:HNH endonuclease [Sphingobium sp. WTD-1]WIA58114.1 HNH endonuclease [Sphingobium sp. WTD-1]